MIAIPKRLLPQNCTVQVPLDDDGFGGRYEEPIELRHVSVEPANTVRPTSYQLQNGTTAVMFVDAVNTEGAFRIPAGSLVTLEGEISPVSVAACHEFAPFGQVHHWEIELA